MKIKDIITEGVAGPKKCWPGHKKVGTQPGTGKNKGKRVNDCEKIEEESKGLYYNVNKRKKAGTSRDASSPKAPTAQAWKDAAKTAKKEGVAEGSLNEFAPDGFNGGNDGEGGFGPFKLYAGDAHKYHHVDTFNSLDAAIEEVEFLIDTDSNLITNYWKIVDGTGEQVWDQDPDTMYDKMRSASKIQYKKPDNKGVAEGERTMSRAAKGYEKYGKAGMQALAKAGRDGAGEKKLDAIRDKHDKYDESVDELSRIQKLSGLALTETLTADQQFDIIEEMVQQLAEEHGVDPEVIWENFESVDDVELLDESAAWRNKSGKNKNGGLNAKGVASYRRENPGSKLQTAVTTKPSKLKPGSKAAKRRKSFCARMGGMKGAMKQPNGKPTRKALALRKWNCESIEDMRQLIENAERYITENKHQRMDPSKVSQAVPELHAALLASKTKIHRVKANKKKVYDIIDGIMQSIALAHDISGQKLHDLWVKKYKEIPDTWIMNK